MSFQILKGLTEKQIKRQEHVYEFVMTEKHHCVTLKVMQWVSKEPAGRSGACLVSGVTGTLMGLKGGMGKWKALTSVICTSYQDIEATDYFKASWELNIGNQNTRSGPMLSFAAQLVLGFGK